MKFKVQASTESTAEIFIYGYLGAFEYSSQDFVRQFEELKSKYKLINVHINSGGGSIFEGVAIFNLIRASKVEVHVYIDGVAASMASVLAMAGSKIYMSRFARLMIHPPSGAVDGDADDMVEYSNLLKSLEKDLVKIYSERTGIDEQQVKDKWMKKGSSTWFTADEALKNKLVDGLYDGPEVKEPDTKAKYQPKDMWNFYNQINYNQNPENMKNLPKIIALFAMVNVSLPADATEDTVTAEIEKLANKHKQLLSDLDKVKNEKTELQDQLKAAGKDKVKNLIDGAISSGRIQEAQRATYTTPC